MNNIPDHIYMENRRRNSHWWHERDYKTFVLTALAIIVVPVATALVALAIGVLSAESSNADFFVFALLNILAIYFVVSFANKRL